MPLIMNATSRPISVCVFGNWFSFTAYPKAGEKTTGHIKLMDDNKVAFLSSRKSDLGFVSLPESLEDLEFRASEEGQEILAKALARDLEMNNIKVDPRVMMEPEMLAHMRELAEYKSASQDDGQKKIDEMKKLEAEIGGSQDI
jgi:hypothetical protein